MRSKEEAGMTITITRQSKTLILFGAVLFLIGLCQGGLIPFFINSRMALSAHLAAVQSGMALMIFGVIWTLVALPEKWLARAL
jgi:hydroxylaminobenzene mutase